MKKPETLHNAILRAATNRCRKAVKLMHEAVKVDVMLAKVGVDDETRRKVTAFYMAKVRTMDSTLVG